MYINKTRKVFPAICTIALAIVVFLIVFTSVAKASTVTQKSPSRLINVVYDDSGSMIEDNDQKVDRWCQAKYSMEVFAAMLGSNDTMNIYVMSDFDRKSGGAKLTLSGSDTQNNNVSKIHTMLTQASNTPFETVEKAYADLQVGTFDERWLVVLTDGQFQENGNSMDPAKADAFFSSKSPSVNVMYLGMGPSAGAITANIENHIFYEKAETSSDILKKITEISTRIFNNNKLDVNKDSKNISFDVPMRELTIFAQGQNLQINGIMDSDDNKLNGGKEIVGVRYCEQAATNYSDVLVATNLVGSIQTFSGEYEPGDYSINVEGADTLEVYYKPNIEITATLTDSEGNEVTDLSSLAAGDYTINFDFVKSGTKDSVGNSKLLGNVKYEASVSNNGKNHEKKYSNGDKITLVEGPLKIDVVGKYLDYNSVSTTMEYTVYKDKDLSFQTVDEADLEVVSDGFTEYNPVKVKVFADGQELNETQWDKIEAPDVSIAGETDFKFESFDVQKSDEKGVFDIYPQFKDGRPGFGNYSNCDLRIFSNQKQGDEVWNGSSDVPMKMHDNRSFLEKYGDKIILSLVILLILLLILGYMPFIKHYLPKRIKKRPSINCRPKIPGKSPNDAKGRYEKSIVSTILPYYSQRGTLKFVPSGVFGVPKLQLRGAKGRRMDILNTNQYRGKEHITFNGDCIEKDFKKKFLTVTAGVSLEVVDKDWIYECQPNM